MPRPDGDAIPLPDRVLVAAVIPSYGRHADVAALLGDLAALDTRSIDLRVIVVDNASRPPLADALASAPGTFDVLRLAENRGGSGGFNAGLREALSDARAREWGRPPDLLWLLDSDARVSRRALRRLVAALRARPDLVAAGAAIHDASTREPYEIGGRVSRRLGTYEPMERGRGSPRRLVPCDYLSACCLLVRAGAVERTGLMPDVFLNCDDIEWTVRLARVTGKGLAAVAGARAFHPPARFVTWARYCQARNAFGPVDALGLGPAVRFLRAAIEGVRAVGMVALGRDDLAGLHVRGLRDAARGRRWGPPPRDVFDDRPARARADLPDAVRELVQPGRAPTMYVDPRLTLAADELDAICASGAAAPAQAHNAHDPSGVNSSRARALVDAAWRFVAGARADVAIVPAADDPRTWFRGRAVVVVAPAGFWTCRSGRWSFLTAALGVLAPACWHGARIALGGPRVADLPGARGP